VTTGSKLRVCFGRIRAGCI